MPDYDLTRLSSRSFEQLIQSIAVGVLGPATVVFGDGPDGGREAVYEGRTNYPSPEHPWDGYIVVQAKFRQRHKHPEVDGAWALAQLSGELKKFCGRRRALRHPEYYIFCTNVVLTPVEKAGAKDRAHRTLADYVRKHKMKGYAIWDYDQLCAYLDHLPGVRQTYAAWITAGDVLASIIREAQWTRADFESLMNNFLQKELLADQYVNLEQAGHAADERTPMARVFVDLPASTQPTLEPPDESVKKSGLLPPGFVQDILTAGSERLVDAISSAPHRDSQGVKPAPGRFVLVAGPGQGKSTVSQFICQLYRASILSTRAPGELSHEVRKALGEISTHSRLDNTELPSCRRFPIRIVLNHFAKELSQRSGDRSLLSYVISRMRSRTNQDISVGDLKQWLKLYPWLLILDGLDEVPPSSNRDDLLAAIQDFWVDAAECQADILVVATTRPQGYEHDFSPEFYSHQYLTPLSRARALQYGSRLAAVRYGNDKDREQRVVGRLRRASAEDATVRLMRSPLQVTIMATLVDQSGQPPRERWRLFHEYYEVIYKREMERDIPAARILREQKSNIDGIHNEVGLILQAASEGSGGTDARLTSADFGRVVSARLSAEGYDGKRLRSLEQKIIEAAMHRLVFLVGMESNQVGFEIRSLQEFMAAEALTDHSDTVVSDRLRAIAAIAHWRNVFLFAAGKCFAVRQHLRDTILSICVTLNEEADDEVSRRTFLGSRLALDILADGTAHQQPKFERTLARTAFKVADRPTSWLASNLGDVYEPRMDEVFREELSGRLAGATPEKTGAWCVLLALVERGLNWASSLADQHWPTEWQRQAEIFTAWIGPESYFPGQRVKSGWVKSRLMDVLSRMALTPAMESGLLWNGDSVIPAWALAVRELIGDRRSCHFIRFGKVELAFHRLSDRKRVCIWERTVGAPADAVGWHELEFVREFVLKPSAAQLAITLRGFANNYDAATCRWLVNCAPWPLAACLRSSGDATRSSTG